MYYLKPSTAFRKIYNITTTYCVRVKSEINFVKNSAQLDENERLKCLTKQQTFSLYIIFRVVYFCILILEYTRYVIMFLSNFFRQAKGSWTVTIRTFYGCQIY